MSKIKIMPESLSNKIAAGEVIERPGSVVKELMENAIDAGSTVIKVEIEKAGSKLIQVSDNGCGMDSDDVMLALEMHGTSKLIDEKDIFNITTMGFRGEALPSIAAVSKFSLTSRRKEDLEGTQLKVSGGKFLEIAPAGCSVGTVIRVEDLFFNIPARKKFLKSVSTEEFHIQEVFMMLALIYPSISFQLIMDKRVVYNSSADNKLDSRLRTFFGKHFANEMLRIDYRSGNYRVYGYIAKAGFTKSSRREQRTFVNNRMVESQAIYRGIRDGYATIAEKGRYSPCVLFVEVPPEELDVNVHPAKREVRFKHEYHVSYAVEEAIKGALQALQRDFSEKAETVLDVAGFSQGKVSLASVMSDAYQTYNPKDSGEFEFYPQTAVSSAEDLKNSKPEAKVLENTPEINSACEVVNERDFIYPEFREELQEEVIEKISSEVPACEVADTPDDDLVDFQIDNSLSYPEKVLAILNNSSILCEGEKGLMIIDQHAAHERVLFEELLKKHGENSVSQALLIPEMLNLSPSYAVVLLKNIKTFQSLGFDIEPMGKNSVMLNAVPISLKITDTSKLIEDMLSSLISEGNTKNTLTLELIAQAACKAAVKFHDNITLDGAKLLLKQLKNCQQPSLCPHGRPTIIEVGYNELIKKFQR